MDELCRIGISLLGSNRDTTIPGQKGGGHPLLQSFHSLFGTFFSDAERLNLGLLNLLQDADLADVRICRVSWAELAGPDRVPGTFGIVPGAWIASGAGGKDGLVYGIHVRDGNVKDELVSRRSHCVS